jgi:predicted nucleotidyltransferase
VASSIEAVLAALNEANVRYLVVGGVAVVLHGHLRTTADLDLVVQLEPENARRALAALATLDYRPRAPVPAQQFADSAIRESWIMDKGLTVFSLWSPRLEDLEVDLFVREPFDFDAAYARAVRAVLDTTTADVAALSDLIALKRAAGRTQDMADIEALERLSSTSR